MPASPLVDQVRLGRFVPAEPHRDRLGETVAVNQDRVSFDHGRGPQEPLVCAGNGEIAERLAVAAVQIRRPPSRTSSRILSASPALRSRLLEDRAGAHQIGLTVGLASAQRAEPLADNPLVARTDVSEAGRIVITAMPVSGMVCMVWNWHPTVRRRRSPSSAL